MNTKLSSPSQLRSIYGDRITLPGDPDYDKSRIVFYSWHDKKPAAIIRVQDEKEIAHVMNYARNNNFELAIRSGGHSNAGYGICDGGIVLDLSLMKKIEIDPKARTAWAEAGITAGEYTNEAAKHGLATGFGDTGSVGLGGLTTGGGVGYLARKHGLAIDNLLAADIVTADGNLLHTDANSHPDLFWAIRGGGGNFGVVTRFKFKLHPLPSIVGGLLILPATEDTISGFIAAAEAAPDELSGIANVMPAPPMPFLPAEMHGKIVIFSMLVYAGETEAGKKALAPFRSLATPLADMMEEMQYAEIFAGPEGPHPVAGSVRTMFVNTIDKKVAATILEHLAASDAPIRVAQLRVLGGAVARVPIEATAYAHRKSKIMVNVASLFENPKDQAKYDAWVSDFAAALDQGDPAAYVNFLADEGEARVHAAYPTETWKRLVEVKRKYDPENFFHLNQNIPPK